MFTWVKGNVYTLVLTLYPNNITLNSSAASYFEDVRRAMIGLDKDSLKLGIRPVARISNKMIIEEISGMINQPINGLKINAAYDETENMLIADLHELAADKG